MLRSLTLRDFVIVDHLELDFQPGFTVLTGETGAGKSILVDALSAVLGERVDAGIVRAGAERAEIAVEFRVAPGSTLAAWLEDQALAGEEPGVCLIRRVVDRSGRSRAWINGGNVTQQQLRDAGGCCVDIHGQHAHQSLLKPASQRALLDAWAGASEQAAAVRLAFQERSRAERSLADWLQRAQALEDERAALRDEVRELRALNLVPDSWAQAQSDHRRLANGGSLLEGAHAALETLSEAEDACIPRVDAIATRLAGLVGLDDRLGQSLELLESARIHLAEAVHSLRHYALGAEFDPVRLQEAEERLQQLLTWARRLRISPEHLHDHLTAAADRLAELEALGSSAQLTAAAESARARYQELAAALSALRAKAAASLSVRVTKTLEALAMAGAHFEVALVPQTEGGMEGLEQVEFRVASHAGLATGSLARVASGGELSRLSLAIQTALTSVAAVPTLIFDEVDVGIGGRVAEIVGRLLHELGARHQVMCVTHLPQVAARADHHLSVTKSSGDSGPRSQVQWLDDAGRVEEVARMLGGVRITATTREHAAELLRGAA